MIEVEGDSDSRRFTRTSIAMGHSGSRRIGVILAVLGTFAFAIGFTSTWLRNRAHPESTPALHEAKHEGAPSAGESNAPRSSLRIDVERSPAVEPMRARLGSLFRIQVAVVDESDRAVPGASAEIVDELCAGDEDDDPKADERKGVTDDRGRLDFDLVHPQDARWLVVTKPGYSTGLAYLGDCFSPECLEARRVALTLTLHPSRSMRYRVVDSSGAPIRDATVRATAAWGEEARASCKREAVTQLTAPEARTDGVGQVSLPLSPELAYFVEAWKGGFAPHASIVAASDPAVSSEIRLARIFAAGICTPDASPGEISMRYTVRREEDSLCKNPRWWLLIEEEERALEARSSVSGVTWRFRIENPDGSPPPDEELALVLPTEKRRVRLPFRPCAEFTVSDIVLVPSKSLRSSNGAITVTFLNSDEGGDDGAEEVSWSMRNTRTLRVVAPSTESTHPLQLTFEGLEDGEWRLVASPAWVGRLMPESEAVRIEDGSRRSIFVDAPKPSGVQFRLDVSDEFGRRITNYRAFLHSSRGYHMLLGRPMGIEHGEYELVVQALGYPEFKNRIHVNSDAIDQVVRLGRPDSMLLPWDR